MSRERIIGEGKGEAVTRSHHESISTFLHVPVSPRNSPIVFLSFPLEPDSYPRSSVSLCSARVISAQEAFDLRFCGDGTIKKCRGEFFFSNPPGAMMTRSTITSRPFVD